MGRFDMGSAELDRLVAYFRVSTDKQGRSGLGLEAQEAAVAKFAAARGGEIIARFAEVESGKRNDRPELVNALAACRKHKATLVIAKLDRLARNVAFIANLMESGVDFIAVDMPSATRLTIHILAAALNARGIKSARGGDWHPATVARVMARAGR
jgi:DNA invertase Pin-like site-specific DNA recombinase